MTKTIWSDIAGLLLAGGVTLRLAGLMASAIWVDEAWTLALARLPLLEMARFDLHDFSPVLWDAMVWGVTRLAGHSLAASRLLALACSLLALWIGWQLTRQFGLAGAQRTAAAAGMALLPGLIWQAQDGRTYALFACLYLLAIWLAVWRRWPGFGAALGLLLYVHATGMVFAGSALVFALLCWPSRWRKIGLAGLLAGAAFLPGLAALAWQVGHARRWWAAGLNLPDVMNNIQLAAWGGVFDHPMWVIWSTLLLPVSVLAALFMLVRAGAHQRNWRDDIRPPGLKLAVVVLGPVAGMLLVSWRLGVSVFYYRPLSAVLPALAIWLAATIIPEKFNRYNWGFAAAWGITLAVGLLGWSPARRGGGLDTLALLIASEWQPGDVVYHATATTLLPMEYYLPDAPQYVLPANNESYALMQPDLQQALGIQQADLAQIDHRRAWVVLECGDLLSQASQKRMSEITAGAPVVGVVRYWQLPVWKIFLIGR